MTTELKTIRASGAVVFRGKGSKRAVALVHRPEYNDWSLPKGKREKREPAYVTAVREVAEETGATITLGAPLGLTRYGVLKGLKEVSWWVGKVERETARRPDREVDEVRWIPVKEARGLMTYRDEQEVLERALAVPATTAFVVVRHSTAMLRKNWTGDDRLRPLSDLGRKQATRLVDLLQAYGIEQIKSSSSTRCLQTLEPFSKASGLAIKPVSLLSEEVGEHHLAGVERYIRKLSVKTGRKAVGTVVCGHRPVLPAMLTGLDIPETAMEPGRALVLHIDDDGHTQAMEWHRPRPQDPNLRAKENAKVGA